MFDPLAAFPDNMMRKNHRAQLFFRDDDVGEWDPSLASLIELFISRGVPLNLAVVPAWLDSKAARRLADLKHRRPDLFCLYQHGFRHINHARSGKRNEFPPSRSYGEQLNDVRAGMEILKKELGEAFFPAFTPPWNRCSPATLDALGDLGFKVFSCDAPTPGASDRGMMDIPITLDVLLRAPEGGWRWRKPHTIMSEMVEQLASLDHVGVMLHHQHANLEFLDILLGAVSDHPAVRFVSFERMDGNG
ncbi:MAG: DUF2334 domain-containing protein [Deltaproteobacteria bacterium]|nr:DUF2334 domain-containing protein [Deltaproteobacteria bacterium]